MRRNFSQKIEKESAVKTTKTQTMKSISQKKNQDFLNIMYFHKRRIIVGGLFCAAYGTLCYNTTSHRLEAVRLGIAGSMANCICECAFHLIDTLNIRSKVQSTDNNKNSSTF
jgi:hypothetical protein